MRQFLIITVAILAAVSVLATDTPTPTVTPTPTPTAVVRTAPASSVASVGTASTTITGYIDFDGCYLINGGNETVFLNLTGGLAELNKGYALLQNAVLFIDNRWIIDDSRKFRAVITGISSGGSDNVFVTMW